MSCSKSCKKKGGVCEGKKCCIPKIAHTGRDEGTGCNHKSVAVEWKGFKAWLLKFYTGNKVKVGNKSMTLKDLLKDRATAKTFFDDDGNLDTILKAKQMVVALQSKRSYDKPTEEQFTTIVNGMRLAEEQIEGARQKVKYPFDPRTTAYSQGAWDKKDAKKFAPEGYELDSFEIGTESAICENCGEIHELDEYEFGAHDEYEEVSCSNLDGSIHGVNLKEKKWKKWRKWVVKQLEPMMGNIERANKKELETFVKSKSYNDVARAGNKLSKNQYIDEPLKTILRCGQTGPGSNVKKFGYTSEPIPDYIMRAIQPKKSVHPEYGKLRY